MAIDPFGAPIPGEHFTSDTKNYPWHRPPQITTIDEAVEACAKKLMEESMSINMMTLVEMGVPIIVLANTLIISGIGAGKWTPDMALMISGPVVRTIEMMAKGYNIKYNLGLTNKKKYTTKHYMDMVKKYGEKQRMQSEMSEALGLPDPNEPKPEDQGGGFAGMQDPMMQKEMIKTEGQDPAGDMGQQEAM